MKNDFTYFGPQKLTFLNANKEITSTPDFVKRSAKNYRFNHITQKLQKKCIECKKYFEVQSYSEGKFTDTHNEEEIHFYSEKSGYDTRCKKCNEEKKDNQKEEQKNNEICDFNNQISQENITYIRIVAAIEQINENQCLNHLLDIIRKKNTLTYTYNQKIN